MDARPVESLQWTPAPSEHFTGDVWFGAMSSEYGEEDVNVLGVQFSPGARTDWHSHPAGQILHVISGSGVVANAAGERIEISAGDTVTTPAGDLHWHGATPDSPMLHLSITHGGPTQWTQDKVTTDQYRE